MKFTASKKIIALVAAAAMLTGVAACGSFSNSSSSGVTEGGKTEITVWSWDSTLPRTVKDFEKANPDITVKVTNAGTNSTEYTALNNALSAGKGAPDLVQIEYYALPMDSGPMAWFYNKDVFDKAGVDPTRVRTWDEFYDAAKKVRATGSYITSDSGDAGFFDSMTWLAGATPFSTGSDGQSVTINLSNDSKVKTFVDFWQKMIADDLIDTKTAGWSDDWNKSLNDGSIASLLTGAWMPYNLLSGAPDGEGKWRVAQMPTPDGSETNSENGGSSLAMVKTDDKAKAEAAYKFAEYACHNAEGIKTRVDGGAFPADNDTLASDDFLNMTSLTDSDGNAHEYFGGQKFNEELAKAAANVSTGYKFLPFEVYARGVYSDDAGGAYTDKSVTLAEGVQAWEKNIKDYASQQGYTVK